MICNNQHSPFPCKDVFCHILQTDLFYNTVLQAFTDLYTGGYTMRPNGLPGICVCPTLLAQTISGKYKLEVSEEQIVMNLPRSKLAYANNDAGEGCIFMLESIF